VNPDLVSIAIQLWMKKDFDPKELPKGEIIEELNKLTILDTEIHNRMVALKRAFEDPSKKDEGCCLDR
jgi:hypothetical protein